MASDFSFHKVCESDSALIDVLFMHGLTGEAKETWSTDSGDFWPEWLQDDLSHCSIYTLGYPASLFEKWAKAEMDIFERAGNILEHLVAKDIGKKPIIFIAHSLGGILTKVLLRKANESEDNELQNIAELTKLVIFVATPHYGASLASVINLIPRSSKHVALLSNQTGYLEDLNSFYRSYANQKTDLSTVVYYETHRTNKIAIVVNKQSADPGVAGTIPIALDKNHINICKPLDKDDTFYLGVKRRVKNLLDTVITSSNLGMFNSNVGMEYSKRSDSDRRDLLNKLVDANRQHEYDFANNAQNEFARHYLKTGLFTSARHDHDCLLSEVETRFITQVYHPLICKGEDDKTISDALQHKVIDPLTTKKIGESRFQAKTIICALYYLTEQCHIRWDYDI